MSYFLCDNTLAEILHVLETIQSSKSSQLLASHGSVNSSHVSFSYIMACVYFQLSRLDATAEL